jgi:tetratricopeptide (TPR) repeat protein
VIVLASSHAASADSAADLLKQGIDLYKAGKYADAIDTLKRSSDLEPKPEALFALAQAERQIGDCASALTHYHAVLESQSDFGVAKFVQQNIELCEKAHPELVAKPEPPKPDSPNPESAKPVVPPKPVTVVKEVRSTDPLVATLLVGGALGLGTAGGLFVAANASRDAANHARTLGDHDSFEHRADVEQDAMYIAGGLGLAMIGVAVFRWTRGDDRGGTDVAVTPTTGGGAVWVTSRW